jgi:hypothetical protein
METQFECHPTDNNATIVTVKMTEEERQQLKEHWDYWKAMCLDTSLEQAQPRYILFNRQNRHQSLSFMLNVIEPLLFSPKEIEEGTPDVQKLCTHPSDRVQIVNVKTKVAQCLACGKLI